MNAARTPQDLTQTAILYVEFVTSTSVTLNGTPGISITLPSITAGASYYLADYSATAGWQAPVAGPGTTSGNTVSPRTRPRRCSSRQRFRWRSRSTV
jgi:hypothetical protein